MRPEWLISPKATRSEKVASRRGQASRRDFVSRVPGELGPANPVEQDAGRDVAPGRASQPDDQPNSRDRHRYVGGEVTKARGVDQHEVGRLALGADQVGKPRLIGLASCGEWWALVGVMCPSAERQARIGVERDDPQPVCREAAGEKHGDRDLAGTTFAAGDGKNGHRRLRAMAPIRVDAIA
jgi:hypothetical protein